MLRYFCIAVSGASLIIGVLLLALWMRSYRWLDYHEFNVGDRSGVVVISQQGKLTITFVSASSVVGNWPEPTVMKELFRDTFALPNCPHPIPAEWEASPTVLREFKWNGYPDGVRAIVPHWFLATVFCIIAVAPSARSFSLRTLLLVTTSIALVLGTAIAFGA